MSLCSPCPLEFWPQVVLGSLGSHSVAQADGGSIPFWSLACWVAEADTGWQRCSHSFVAFPWWKPAVWSCMSPCSGKGTPRRRSSQCALRAIRAHVAPVGVIVIGRDASMRHGVVVNATDGDEDGKRQGDDQGCCPTGDGGEGDHWWGSAPAEACVTPPDQPPGSVRVTWTQWEWPVADF